jgi:hypothetical protein
MNKNILNHKSLEKTAILFFLGVVSIIAVYFFVFEIDWVDVYSKQDLGNIKNISALSESCIQCHGEVIGFSTFHNPQKIGCASCHLGNTLVKTKNEAHNGMILIPGNSGDAKLTCGQANCHPGISERIDSSLMSTMSGIVSVDKYMFDEIELPTGKYHIEKIGNSASESHLRNLCASCHLGNEKTEYGPITELSRGGGCNACHLNYSTEALNEFSIYDSLKTVLPDSALLKFHPSLSLNITNDHCFGCHSRSGRISTSYEGWHETGLTKEEAGDREDYRLLEDGRIFKMIKPDVHYEAGLICVDCHISYEVMGDGKYYEHKEEQILVKCEDCHSLEKHDVMTLAEFDFESKKIAEINGIDDEDRKFIRVKKSQTPLVNTFLKNGREGKLVGKKSKQEYNLNPPKFSCVASQVHGSLSCNSCHTSWAPQCVGCHTDYQPNIEGFDLLDNKDTESTWVEYHGEYFAELPTLGVREENENGRIRKVVDTFIPGMIMTLDKSKYEIESSQPIFKRLFAPSVAHTTQKESRSCESCHNNSLALGYGRGNLEYIVNNNIGRWLFESEFGKYEYDDLPEDAWIGFLKTRTKNMATRTNVRPFSVEEQQNILTVGACLTCHKPDSDIMKSSLSDYKNQLLNLTKECILPTWE